MTVDLVYVMSSPTMGVLTHLDAHSFLQDYKSFETNWAEVGL